MLVNVDGINKEKDNCLFYFLLNYIVIVKNKLKKLTKMAPNFSNVFMHELEQKFLTDVLYKPSVWWRFIDDIFALWPWGVDELHEFMNRLNLFHPPVKFL